MDTPGAGARAVTSHDFVDHTSEITVRAQAPSYPALMAEMAVAFAELVPAHLLGEPLPGEQELHVEGGDRVGVLVEWLNELVYRAEVELWIPVRTKVEAAEACAAEEGRPPDNAGVVVRARAQGRALVAPFVLVKAATLHGASVTDDGVVCRGEVTLDV